MNDCKEELERVKKENLSIKSAQQYVYSPVSTNVTKENRYEEITSQTAQPKQRYEEPPRGRIDIFSADKYENHSYQRAAGYPGDLVTTPTTYKRPLIFDNGPPGVFENQKQIIDPLTKYPVESKQK